jgi:predicted outer membrane repeat protein
MKTSLRRLPWNRTRDQHVRRARAHSALDFERLEDRRLLATYMVNSVLDSSTGSGTSGTLRYCINQIDANGGTNAIQFSSATFNGAETITLTQCQLELKSGTTTITGPTAGVTVSGGSSTRVFQVDSGVTATMTNLDVTNGSLASGNGAGINNNGTLTLNNCGINNNATRSGSGGGIENTGSLTLNQDAVSSCTVSGDGGAVNNESTGTLSAQDTFFLNDTAQDNGGAIRDVGAASVTACTFSGNQSTGVNSGDGDAGKGFGAALFTTSSSTLAVTDCTFVGNTAAGSGGAIEAQGPVTVESSTFTLNTAGIAGGAIDNYAGQYAVKVGDSILSGDHSGAPEFCNAVTSLGHNLVSNTANSTGWTSSDFQNMSPTLGPLGDYGGPTESVPLLPGSKGIGQGTLISGITTDQRGFALPSTNPDIGAFQTGPFVVNTIVDGVGSPFGDLSLRQAVNPTFRTSRGHYL